MMNKHACFWSPIFITFIFIILKLTGVIFWPWWAIFVPVLIIPFFLFVIGLISFLGFVIGMGIIGFIAALFD